MTTAVTDMITIPKGALGVQLNFTVYNNDGTAFNLTGLTITFKVWKAGVSGTLKVSGACPIDVAASGTCHYITIATDFDTQGRYLWELEFTKAGYVDNTDPGQLVVTESG